MNNLRDRSSDSGLLKEGQPLETGQKPLLPYNIYSDLDSGSTQIRPVAPIECRRGTAESPQERSVPCFLCGDLRCNEQVIVQLSIIDPANESKFISCHFINTCDYGYHVLLFRSHLAESTINYQ